MSFPGRFRVVEVDGDVITIENDAGITKKVGCSREEVAETVLLAAALRAGGAAAHGALALKIYDQA